LATSFVTLGVEMFPSGTVAGLRGATAAAVSDNTVLTTTDIGNATILRGVVVYRASA
jgi:hypothetical protein